MAMGGSFKVDGPAGPLTVDVSAGTPSGAVITLPRQGHAERDRPRPRRAFTCASSSTCPKKLSKDQKKLVEQLGQTMPVETIEATPPDADKDKPFFEKVKDLFG